jgi:hypothetical protein
VFALVHLDATLWGCYSEHLLSEHTLTFQEIIVVSGPGVLVAAHIICTTLGYGALIISNVGLAVAARSRDPVALRTGLQTALAIERIFGPVLGVGVLLGIATLFVMRVPAFSPWLIASYALMVLALVLQGIAIPSHIRGLRDPLSVTSLTSTLVAAGFASSFILIVALMVTRPTAF